ncbi:hypothetical protein IAT40_000785 [Kwoniella sp. CBS 6097]
MTISPFPNSGPASSSSKREEASTEDAGFDGLPSFDASKFQPPSWASDSFFTRKNGESSKSKSNTGAEKADRSANTTTDDGDERRTRAKKSSFGLDDDDSDYSDHRGYEERDFDNKFAEEDEEDEEEDVWSDAKSVIEPEEARFTLPELKELLSRALGHKETGNKAFTSKPPKYEEAVQSYKLAIDHLPNVDPPKLSSSADKDTRTPEPAPGARDEGKAKASVSASASAAKMEGSGIQEVTDEEAAVIEREMRHQDDPEVVERKGVEDDIRETTKACWGNLAACYIALKEDPKAVEACTEALKIDPKYVKGLHRRATANERIGSLTALSSAKDDYTTLQTLLPASSPLHPSIRRSLSTLPERIKVAEKESMDEMMGKLKDLGNMFLGNFGLSTDNFKFEQGAGGGYNMQFQR